MDPLELERQQEDKREYGTSATILKYDQFS